MKVPKIIDAKLLKFGVVGIINTIVGTAIMFGLYNFFDMSYWVSSASNYILTSILSYFLNRHFTFKDKGNVIESGLRFFINIACCYLIAYGVAKPLIYMLMSHQSKIIQENISMVLGMCLFVALNYIGQRYFVFNKQRA